MAVNINIPTQVSQTITNGVTAFAPSEDAVFDALALKQDTLTNPVTGTGENGQVSFWTGTGSQSGDNGLFWDNTNKRLRINQTTDAGFRLDVNGTVRVQGGSLLGGDVTIGGGTQNYVFSKRANVLFTVQGQNSDSASQFEYYTKDGDGTDDVGFAVFARGIPTNITNFEQFRFYYAQSITSYVIGTNKGGTGLDRDIRIGNSLTPSNLIIKATSGNILLNTTTDAGFRLDVNGTARVQGQMTVRGAGNTSGTSALVVTNSDGQDSFRVLNNKTVQIVNTQSASNLELIGSANWWRIQGRYTGGLEFINHSQISTILVRFGEYVAVNTNNINGISGFFPFNPTSGTSTFTQFLSQPTINQTGGANGITRGLFVNPILTSAANWRSIETSNNIGYAAFFGGSAPLFFNNGANLEFGTATGSRIGTATNQKLAFWNATPIVQPINTTPINEVLTNTGLMASGSTSTTISNDLVVSGSLTVTGDNNILTERQIFNIQESMKMRTFLLTGNL
jgi:hypothetical protein